MAELPLTVPIDSQWPKGLREQAEKALERAREVGDELRERRGQPPTLRPGPLDRAGIIHEARDRASS